MHAHPHFAGISILDDDELSSALGSTVVERSTLHAWPLTSTDEVLLADGRRFAYKAQVPPTVESEFYAAVSIPLLPDVVDLGRSGETRHLATAWIDAPRLGEPDADETEFVARARDVVTDISGIPADAPVYLDFSTDAGWESVIGETARLLRLLIDAGSFSRFPRDAPEQVTEWSRSAKVRDALNSEARISHGDLSPEEVFVTPHGYRIIDWQRPVLGPVGIDLVSLLVHRSIDTRRHVAEEIVGIASIVLLHWAALAPDLVPDAPRGFSEGWGLEALERILGTG